MVKSGKFFGFLVLLLLGVCWVGCAENKRLSYRSYEAGDARNQGDFETEVPGEDPAAPDMGTTPNEDDEEDGLEEEPAEPPNVIGEGTTLQLCNSSETSDPFVFDAVGLDESADVLSVLVSYSGGCAEHGFALCWTGAIEKSEPPQATVRLLHDANGDTCRAVESREHTFSLTPLRDAYVSQFEDPNGVLILNLDGFGMSIPYHF